MTIEQALKESEGASKVSLKSPWNTLRIDFDLVENRTTVWMVCRGGKVIESDLQLFPSELTRDDWEYIA